MKFWNFLIKRAIYGYLKDYTRYKLNINCIKCQLKNMGRVAQSVKRLTTAWSVRVSNPGGARFSARPDRLWGLLNLPYNGYRVFPGGKERPGRNTDNSPLLVSRSWKSRAIPLPSLWATTGPVTGTLYF